MVGGKLFAANSFAPRSDRRADRGARVRRARRSLIPLSPPFTSAGAHVDRSSERPLVVPALVNGGDEGGVPGPGGALGRSASPASMAVGRPRRVEANRPGLTAGAPRTLTVAG